jgi:hypothetical protein
MTSTMGLEWSRDTDASNKFPGTYILRSVIIIIDG